MDTLNRQEFFNTTWNGLKAQGFVRSGKMSKKGDEGFKCLYRGPNGMKCGLGFHISDEKYKKSIENKGPHDKVVLKALDLPIDLDYSDVYWLGDLQICHDGADTPEKMEENLRYFAGNNSLAVPG